tara:strand:+ start:491 stop:889 length:399 start_codon:yes stop_codon:yes gene_type:complete
MPGENVGVTGKKGQDTGMKSSEIAYLAGLFDGEGCVTYKQRLEHRKGKPKAYLYWQIRLEINMIDKETIDYVANAFACGSRDYRKPYPHQNYGQYRWQCTHRDALRVAKQLVPFSITKKDKLEKIIKHYEVE